MNHDPSVFLTGRPPLGEYLGFVSGQVDGTADLANLTNEWRTANEHTKRLEREEAGEADKVGIRSLPKSLAAIEKRVLADPMFKRTFQVVPAEVQMVELDKLVVFQKNINLAHVERLKTQLGANPSEETIAKLCLPYDHPTPAVKRMRVAQNAFVFMSDSNDLRFLEPTMLEANQVQGFVPQGPVAGIVGLVAGFGSNYLNAIHFGGRLVLNNGSHRAYTLRDLGVEEVPCIVQRATSEDEIPVICPQMNENLKLYIENPRPPMLKDYFDPKLRRVLDVPRKARQVRITFGIEQIDIPG